MTDQFIDGLMRLLTAHDYKINALLVWIILLTLWCAFLATRGGEK